MFRFVVIRGAVILGLVVLLGGAATLALYGHMRDNDSFATGQLPALQAAARLSGNAAILTSLSSRQLAVGTAAELATLADRIEDRAGMMAADLDDLGALGLDDATLGRLRTGHAALVQSARELGVVLREIAVLGRGGAAADPPVALLRDRTRLLQRQEVLASEMATLVAALAHEAESRVQASRELAAERTWEMMILLALSTMVVALVLVGLYRSLRRRLLDRLQALTEALADWRSGGRPVFRPGSQGDEITDLAEALSELVNAVDRRTAELVAQATTDPLTGLPNRRGFEERAAETLALAKRYGGPVSAITGDIDRFKVINDTYGHATGDRVLCEVARVWRAALRDVDISSRLGGEEFAALLPNTDDEAAAVVAERIREAVDGLRMVLHDGRTVTCTISIGVAGADPGDDVGSLLARADLALYEAKARGRDRVVRAARDQVA